MQRLQIELAEKISEIFGWSDNFLNIKNVSMRKDVRDATFKFLAENSVGEALVFILAANDEFPDTVHWAAQASERAKATVGEELAHAVVTPLNTGYVGQNSYAVYPCYTPTTSGLTANLFRRYSIDLKVFQWLSDVAKKTSKRVDDAKLEELVITPLKWLLDCSAFSDAVKNDAQAALYALDAKQWQPGCVFSHNDLWKGNVLVESKYGRRFAACGLGEPRIIDWLGSSAEGIPAFDVIRYAQSSGYSLPVLQNVIKRINREAGVNDADVFFDLLAGMGRLGINRGEFPLARYTKLAENTINTYKLMAFATSNKNIRAKQKNESLFK
ncbi:MAG: hypothetical protein ABL933_07390 [Methyloglobulus sp.]|nr:hypothetical protein [Methyloglobulus sp.]